MRAFREANVEQTKRARERESLGHVTVSAVICPCGLGFPAATAARRKLSNSKGPPLECPLSKRRPDRKKDEKIDDILPDLKKKKKGGLTEMWCWFVSHMQHNI